MKLTRKQLKNLISEAVEFENNFDENTGEPINTKGFSIYIKNPKNNQAAKKKINAALRNIAGTLNKKFNNKDIGAIVTQSVVSTIQKTPPDQSNRIMFTLYQLGEDNTQTTTASENDDHNERLQKMIDLTDNQEEAEFFRKQMR